MTSNELDNLVRIGTLNAVFQPLPHTLGVPASIWRTLAHCHQVRNQSEYEGVLEIDERLVTDLVAATTDVLAALRTTK